MSSFLLSSVQPLLPYGLTCLASHFALWAFFRYGPLPQGPWKEMPHFSAHQTVALFLMIQWTYLGFFGDDAAADEKNLEHLPTILRPSPFGMSLAQRGVAALWIWDIPVSTFTKDMGQVMDPIMHAHHLGMLLIACVVLGYLTLGEASSEFPNPVGSSLAPIFFGQVELSSIPLQIVDLFHPKKSPSWHKFMKSSPLLQKFNEMCRQLFALLFLAVRGAYFPFVVATKVLPDFWDALTWTVLHPNDTTKYILPIVIVISFSVAFTFLQIYWAVLIVRQIYTALSGGKGKEKKT